MEEVKTLNVHLVFYVPFSRAFFFVVIQDAVRGECVSFTQRSTYGSEFCKRVTAMLVQVCNSTTTRLDWTRDAFMADSSPHWCYPRRRSFKLTQ